MSLDKQFLTFQRPMSDTKCRQFINDSEDRSRAFCNVVKAEQDGKKNHCYFDVKVVILKLKNEMNM